MSDLFYSIGVKSAFWLLGIEHDEQFLDKFRLGEVVCDAWQRLETQFGGF